LVKLLVLLQLYQLLLLQEERFHVTHAETFPNPTMIIAAAVACSNLWRVVVINVQRTLWFATWTSTYTRQMVVLLLWLLLLL
jgi:hypothetical protein